ncbi:MAG: flagellar biosynthesis anti-sigma factor FlgM [Steroidobacteraceae bacterium]
MTLKLSGLDVIGAPASAAPKAATTQSTSTLAQNATQQHTARVSITSTASMLARLQQALAASSAVDRGRVDAISTALAAGTYRVNGDNIARGLINTERALGQLELAEI